MEAAYAEDREADGYVANFTRLWSWRPDLLTSFAELRARLMEDSTLSERELAVLVTATVAALRDSYCALAWGPRLAVLSDEATAAQILAGKSAPALSAREAALAVWARELVRDPNATADDDVARLREVGLSDREIFEATGLVAFRLAFSTVQAPTRSLSRPRPSRSGRL